jgi:hypothetical protein
MNGFGFAFALLTAALLLALPRRWAPLPFLMGSACITLKQEMELGPLHFPVVRILIAVGFLRVIVKRERIAGGVGPLDQLMVLWALWAIVSAAFHKSGVLVFRAGAVYDALGSYLLFRVLLRGVEDVRHVFKMVCIILVPLAVCMIKERFTGRNPLSLIGFGLAEPEFRNGYFRAQGPFAHPILAGTVGAVSMPAAVALWRDCRKLALAGLAAATIIVFSSGSSGPLIATLAVLGAMALWKIRHQTRAIRWAAVIMLLALNAVMNAPVYYLVQRIDITGGSQSWFRARLIESAFEHLNEWWLTGTDYTRHWMATGISANPNHVDVTNHYLAMGIWGGLPLMALFVGVLFAAFSRVGRALRANENAPIEDQFLIWTLGCILLGHAVAIFSISYFDQTFIFLQLALAAIGSLQVSARATVPVTAGTAVQPSVDHELGYGSIS